MTGRMVTAIAARDKPFRASSAATTLFRVEDEPKGALASPRTVALGSGRSLEITGEASDERLIVRAAGGQIMLSVRLTDEGPVLSLEGVSLEISAQKRLTLSSETLTVTTTGDATMDFGGSLHERTRGNAIREAGKASIERAREVKVEASPGGISMKANDDVDIKGERVRLNSDDPPMPLTWEEHRARQAERLAAGNSPPALSLPEGWPGRPPGSGDD